MNHNSKSVSNNLLSGSWITGISSIIITSIGLSTKNVGLWVFGIILLLMCFAFAAMSYHFNKPVTYNSFSELCKLVDKLEKRIKTLESQEISNEPDDTNEDTVVV